MRFALVNPHWDFRGSIYFGCREPHFPLELGYARALLEGDGHEVLLVDGQLEDLTRGQIRGRVEKFRPDLTVFSTAPTYLFWRCPPPELRVPQLLASDLRPVAGEMIAVGPHASTSPSAVLKKLGVRRVILGECEEVLLQLARTPRREWPGVEATAYFENGELRVRGRPHSADLSRLPALRWPADLASRHRHHHHRFDAEPAGPGAEIEASRGCPFHCLFCAKETFRNEYRRRLREVILEEIDGLISQGVRYFYFVDEIFLPDRDLLGAVRSRGLRFGVQTRIDLWSEEMLELLGEAGCVSIEAGVESITEEGRRRFNKPSRLSMEATADRLAYAKRRIAFVQANLLDGRTDRPEAVQAWRRDLRERGVWASEPVPLFAYPGSPEYRRRWGGPDHWAWERAHTSYLETYGGFSDLQDAHPLPLSKLEWSALS